LVKVAAEEDLSIKAIDIEFHLPRPSYTINTLKSLRHDYGNEVSLAFIMGMDSFLHLSKWYLWQELSNFAHIIVVNRPNYYPIFSTELQEWLNKRRCNDRQMLEYQPSGLVYFVDSPFYAISSTDIRKALQQGHSTHQQLIPAVANYIYHHHLYGATATNES